MSIVFYSISILLLFILFCIIRKTEKKIDIIPMIIITFLCILAYQVLVSCILTTLNISINLLNLGIINTIFCIIFILLIKRNKIQSFVFSKKDIVMTTILILVVSFIAYKNVGFLEDISYSSTDASIHYIAAKEFYQNDKMLNKTIGTETVSNMMPMAYVNVGILFKVFAPIIGEINLYKIFVLFDITIFCFLVLLFYYIIKNEANKKWHYFLIGIISFLYLIGYPLNNLLSGFYYLGVGCLTISAILYIISAKKIEIQIKRVILFLLNTGIILSYSLFTPVVYLSIFIYDFYINYKKYNKRFNKEFIINTIITLIIPGIFGVIYMLLPNIESLKCISIDGYIYKNLLENIIFFIPFAIYFMIKAIKNKKIDYMLIYFIVLIIYMTILFIGTKLKIVSEYYFTKNAYILWTILLIYFFYGIKKFIEEKEKGRIIAIIYLSVYIILFVLNIPKDAYILSIYDLYKYNSTLIDYRENLSQDDIDMLEYIYNQNILNNTENNVFFVADFMQEAWIRSICTYRNRNPLEKNNYMQYIQKWNKGEIQYLVCFETSNIYQKLKDYINFNEKKVLYHTEKATLYIK